MLTLLQDLARLFCPPFLSPYSTNKTVIPPLSRSYRLYEDLRNFPVRVQDPSATPILSIVINKLRSASVFYPLFARFLPHFCVSAGSF
jgi:hypothetical protein